MNAAVRVTVPKGIVGNFEVVREDYHTLSLSSENKSCIEWNSSGKVVKDHGWVGDAEEFHAIMGAFMKGGD